MYLSEREIWKLMHQAYIGLTSLSLPSNSAVIFDIDMTLIDESGNRIEPVCWFYEQVLKENFTAVLVTARPSIDSVIERTNRDLQSCGIVNYDSIYFRDPAEKNVEKYKTSARRNIWERGFNVIMSVGDQPWDIGEYGGIGILLQE